MNMGIVSKGAKCNFLVVIMMEYVLLILPKLKMLGYVYHLVVKRQYFANYTIKNGKKKLKMIDR